jgi:hypothetical protein
VHAMKSIRDSQSLCNLSLHDLRLFAPIVLRVSGARRTSFMMKVSCLKMKLRPSSSPHLLHYQKLRDLGSNSELELKFLLFVDGPGHLTLQLLIARPKIIGVS